MEELKKNSNEDVKSDATNEVVTEKGSTDGFQKEHNEKAAEVSAEDAAEGDREKSDAV
jgi:hypothetical protein